jgi:hypothetical protein
MQPFLMIRSEAQLGQEGFLAVIPYANSRVYPYLLGTSLFRYTRACTAACLRRRNLLHGFSVWAELSLSIP